jgi:hypothetical protein
MGGQGRTLEEEKKENPLNKLVNYYKEEGPVRIIGATSLTFTNDLIYGVIASISYGMQIQISFSIHANVVACSSPCNLLGSVLPHGARVP